jgi:hypothetical protein
VNELSQTGNCRHISATQELGLDQISGSVIFAGLNSWVIKPQIPAHALHLEQARLNHGNHGVHGLGYIPASSVGESGSVGYSLRIIGRYYYGTTLLCVTVNLGCLFHRGGLSFGSLVRVISVQELERSLYEVNRAHVLSMLIGGVSTASSRVRRAGVWEAGAVK